MRHIIPYNPKLKEIARKLRNNMTKPEIALWKRLYRKQMLGYDFDRQKPIDKFIVDFYCKDLQLAIEIDGISHDGEEAWKADKERQKILENLGIKFLRFSHESIVKHLDDVVKTIENWIKKSIE